MLGKRPSSPVPLGRSVVPRSRLSELCTVASHELSNPTPAAPKRVVPNPASKSLSVYVKTVAGAAQFANGLRACSVLESLTLWFTADSPPTETLFPIVANLPQSVKSVKINALLPQVCGALLSADPFPGIKHLELSSCRVREVCDVNHFLRAVATSLPNLEHLVVRLEELSAYSVPGEPALLPGVRILDLSCDGDTKALGALVSACPNVETLMVLLKDVDSRDLPDTLFRRGTTLQFLKNVYWTADFGSSSENPGECAAGVETFLRYTPNLKSLHFRTNATTFPLIEVLEHAPVRLESLELGSNTTWSTRLSRDVDKSTFLHDLRDLSLTVSHSATGVNFAQELLRVLGSRETSLVRLVIKGADSFTSSTIHSGVVELLSPVLKNSPRLVYLDVDVNTAPNRASVILQEGFNRLRFLGVPGLVPVGLPATTTLHTVRVYGGRTPAEVKDALVSLGINVLAM